MAKAIELRSIRELAAYARNPRTHSDEQVDQIGASIIEFGFNNPILVDTRNGIIAGHGRLLAARKLGLEQVPVAILDHLTEAQKRAYIIADNKLALNAGWDEELLRSELAELRDADFDIGVIGFAVTALAFATDVAQCGLAASKCRPQASQVARALVPAAWALLPTLARATMHPRHDSRAWTKPRAKNRRAPQRFSRIVMQARVFRCASGTCSGRAGVCFRRCRATRMTTPNGFAHRVAACGQAALCRVRSRCDASHETPLLSEVARRRAGGHLVAPTSGRAVDSQTP